MPDHLVQLRLQAYMVEHKKKDPQSRVPFFCDEKNT